MVEYNTELYYALLWRDEIDSSIVTGCKVHRGQKLITTPSMLYGTCQNDSIKIKSIDESNEFHYDYVSGRQSFRVKKEVKEYIIPRDIYILVWQGKRVINTEYDEYRIVSPEDFELIAEQIPEDNSANSEHFDKYLYPERDIRRVKQLKII